MEEAEEPYVMRLESSDSDDTHGDFEDFLDGLDVRLPDLAIAVYATYVDVEYGEGDESSVYFSPPGRCHFALGGRNTGCLMAPDQLPDEDWILHLYLDEFTGPNAARSYANHSVWHFLIASDGEKLISNFTWCGTYSFGGWCGTDYHSLYVRSLQKKLVKFI